MYLQEPLTLNSPIEQGGHGNISVYASKKATTKTVKDKYISAYKQGDIFSTIHFSTLNHEPLILNQIIIQI